MTTPLGAGAGQPQSCFKVSSSASQESADVIEVSEKKPSVCELWSMLKSCRGAVVSVWPSPPRGGLWFLIQADFIQLWNIPSVKCHLFYIYSTEMTHKFSLSPSWVYTVRNLLKQMKRPLFKIFVCIFIFSFHHSFRLLTVNSKPRPVLNSIMRPVMSSKCTLLHPLFVMVRGEVFAGSFI